MELELIFNSMSPELKRAELESRIKHYERLFNILLTSKEVERDPRLLNEIEELIKQCDDELRKINYNYKLVSNG